MEPTEPVVLDPAAREAVHAARDAAQAVEVARQSQMIQAAEDAATKAATLAAQRVADQALSETRLAEIIHRQMTEVLGAGTDSEKAIVLARVPYICADIKTINANLEVIKEALSTYPIVKTLVFGVVGLILTTFFGALIALVIRS